jgi:hypothetical protein
MPLVAHARWCGAARPASAHERRRTAMSITVQKLLTLVEHFPEIDFLDTQPPSLPWSSAKAWSGGRSACVRVRVGS